MKARHNSRNCYKATRHARFLLWVCDVNGLLTVHTIEQHQSSGLSLLTTHTHKNTNEHKHTVRQCHCLA